MAAALSWQLCGALWAMRGMTYTGDRYCPTVAMGTAAANLSLAQLRTTGGCVTLSLTACAADLGASQLGCRGRDGIPVEH